MCKQNFDYAFERVIGHEGGFQQDYNDRGNWTEGRIGKGELKGTKFGITAMMYPDIDIKNLTPAAAKKIYQKDYWSRLDLSVFDKFESYLVFDAAINHGAGNAIRFVQGAVGVVADGVIGPVTRQAIKKRMPVLFCVAFLSHRLMFFTHISTWGNFGKGWARRVAKQMKEVSGYYENS